VQTQWSGCWLLVLFTAIFANAKYHRKYILMQIKKWNNTYSCTQVPHTCKVWFKSDQHLKVTCRGIFMLFFKLGKGCPIKHLKRYKSEINKKIQNKKYPKCFFLLITNRGKLACIIIGYVYIFCVFICRWTNNLHGCVIVCGFFVVMCGGQERQPNHHVFAPIIYSLHREAAKVFKKIFWEILSQEEKIFFFFFCKLWI
jgi:hypothetical protein